VHGKTPPTPVVRCLSGPDLELLERAAVRRGVRDTLIVHLLSRLGLRVGELCGLRMDDAYDLTNGTVLPWIHIRKETAKRGRARDIPTPVAVRGLLTDYLQAYCRINPEPAPHSPLFIGRKTRDAMQDRDIQRLVSKLGQAALRRRVWPHMLRHTFATQLIKKTDIHTLKTLLGHSRLESTGVYLHTDSERQRDALNRAFGDAPDGDRQTR